MNCVCHDEPCYWQRDKRHSKGGWWECSVSRRQRSLDYYDRNPKYRIEKALKANRRKRQTNLKRRRERSGALPE